MSAEENTLMRKVILIILIVCVFILSFGCVTIKRQEMTYLGDDSVSIENVTGKVHHVDWLGIGVDGDKYFHEYNEAIQDAMSRSPEGTLALTNIKAFREEKIWPLLLSSASMAVGTALFNYDSYSYRSWPVISAGVIYLVGAIAGGLTIYDFYVIGEPVPGQE